MIYKTKFRVAFVRHAAQQLPLEHFRQWKSVLFAKLCGRLENGNLPLGLNHVQFATQNGSVTTVAVFDDVIRITSIMDD